MAVTIIVEDGSIVPGANSYISLADANTYLGNWYGTDWTGLDATAQASALFYAAFALDRLYGRKYLSVMPPTSGQTMLWPRYTFMDNTFRLIGNGQIPQCIKDAQCEMAMLHTQGVSLFQNESDNRLFRDIQLDMGVKIKKAYWAKPTDVETYDGFRKVELILYPVLERCDNKNASLTL